MPMYYHIIYVTLANVVIPLGAVDTSVEGRIYVATPYIYVKRDTTAVLECIPYGNPVPQIVWSRVSHLLKLCHF